MFMSGGLSGHIGDVWPVFTGNLSGHIEEVWSMFMGG